MAGVKGRSGGHNRKTSATLKMEGGLVPCRHKDRVDLSVSSAVLVPPSHLKEPGLECWNDIITTLPPDSITRADRTALSQLCDMVDMYEDIIIVARNDPTDKNAGVRLMNVMQRMDAIGRQFGWTPVSRAALRFGSTETKSSAIGEIFQLMGVAN